VVASRCSAAERSVWSKNDHLLGAGHLAKDVLGFAVVHRADQVAVREVGDGGPVRHELEAVAIEGRRLGELPGIGDLHAL
jgi:hypothetical protein